MTAKADRFLSVGAVTENGWRAAGYVATVLPELTNKSQESYERIPDR